MMIPLADTIDAQRLFEVSAPRSRAVHLIATPAAHQLLAVDGSRLYEIDFQTYEQISELSNARDEEKLERLLNQLGVSSEPWIGDDVLEHPPVRALSLAVAQKCNLGCTYCYAHQGDFGGVAKNMPVETALRAVDLLFSDVHPGERVNLAFLGGEPLMNRTVIHKATERATQIARDRDAQVTFSVTTNGTLVGDSDADFFEAYGFAVTISLDGLQQTHDALRPFKGGVGTFERIIENVSPLLTRQRRMQVSARVTVTPANLNLKETLDAFVALGFQSVGFSPLLNPINGMGEMEEEHLKVMLGQMVACGHEFERRLVAHERYPFSNIVNALREIHKGTHRPYPCGAGAGYFGVSADGDLAACHRFVGDAENKMGSLADGVDRHAQALWLSGRHVHRQEPCNGCWARYMCGGGCHHEVIQRGRTACNYIRGWLHYCLEAYSRLSVQVPDWFASNPGGSTNFARGISK
jgi:uncharacterized protein